MNNVLGNTGSSTLFDRQMTDPASAGHKVMVANQESFAFAGMLASFEKQFAGQMIAKKSVMQMASALQGQGIDLLNNATAKTSQLKF